MSPRPPPSSSSKMPQLNMPGNKEHATLAGPSSFPIAPSTPVRSRSPRVSTDGEPDDVSSRSRSTPGPDIESSPVVWPSVSSTPSSWLGPWADMTSPPPGLLESVFSPDSAALYAGSPSRTGRKRGFAVPEELPGVPWRPEVDHAATNKYLINWMAGAPSTGPPNLLVPLPLALVEDREDAAPGAAGAGSIMDRINALERKNEQLCADVAALQKSRKKHRRQLRVHAAAHAYDRGVKDKQVKKLSQMTARLEKTVKAHAETLEAHAEILEAQASTIDNLRETVDWLARSSGDPGKQLKKRRASPDGDVESAEPSRKKPRGEE